MARLTDQNRLSLTRPDLIEQWHHTKNGSLTPDDVSFGSRKKIWWKCSVVDDHEWEAPISTRTISGCGCPCCKNLKVVLSNCLATTHPELAVQWHPVNNGSLTPYDVVYGSDKKVWWKCQVADDHEWQASSNIRTNNNSGCPCCSGKKVVFSNCLATTHPELVSQWHPTKNESLTPQDVTSGSGRMVWWKCLVADDHEWQATIGSRANGGRGCSCCTGFTSVFSNCLATINPELAEQWHPIKNGILTPLDVAPHSNKKVWWKCHVVGHEWEARICSRTNGYGCPYCWESKGEKEVDLILSYMGYQFEREVKFEGCVYKGSLFFDFLVLIPNGKRFLIEFHGEQHYKPVRWDYSFSDERMKYIFEETQRRDSIKKQWAQDQGIPLLVIPHWDKGRVKFIIESFIRDVLEG